MRKKILVLLHCLISLTVPSYNKEKSISIITRKFLDNDDTAEVPDESLEKNAASASLALEYKKAFYALPELYYQEISSTYGGIYIDFDDVLVINYVDYDIDLVNIVDSVNVDGIEYRTQEVIFAYESLMEVKDYIDINYSSLVQETDYAEDANIISIMVENTEDEATLISELDYHYVNFNPNMIQFSYENSSNVADSLTIKAGEKINRGTVGFNAVDSSGNQGVVTNYHVIEPGQDAYDENGYLIGTCSTGELSETVDASFVPFATEQWQCTQYVKSNDPSMKLAEVRDPIQGRRVWKIGNTTGNTYGRILSIHSSVTLYYNAYGKQYKRDLIKTSCKRDGGDSGGPLITWDDRRGGQGLLGIHFAGNNNYAYAIKIENILNTLDVSLYTGVTYD